MGLSVKVDTGLHVLALCLLLASAETLHGIVRTVFVSPRIGKAKATQLSAVTGTGLAFMVCYALVPDMHLRTPQAHFALGIGLAVFMAAFDVGIGRLLMHRPWRKIWRDFNPATGNYLLYGLSALCFIPLVIWYLQNM